MSSQRLRTRVLPRPRTRSAWAAPLLLVLAVVLVAGLAFNVANLDLGGQSIPGAPAADRTPGSYWVLVSDSVATILLFALLPVLFVGTLILLIRRRVRPRPTGKRASWWDVVTRVLGLLILVAVFLAWPRALRAAKATVDDANAANGGGPATAVFPIAAGWPIDLALVGLLLAAVLAIVLLLRRSRRVDWATEDDTSGGPRASAAVAVSRTIQDLEAGRDVRSAILVCFQRFCELLGSRGITEQGALTPRELEALAVHRLRVSSKDSRILTGVFEEARYSTHPLGEPDRQRALQSLGQIRAALEA
jgi:hypothetical protein